MFHFGGPTHVQYTCKCNKFGVDGEKKVSKNLSKMSTFGCKCNK